MDRCVTIHGHFYQPPRENPWLETVQVQPSAYPYHDWNERITAECYQQNAASRILDDTRTKIVEIMNNYACLSFDIGPTLLAWLERHAPDVYAAILDADRRSCERFDGHGAAMAQAYNHLILPLANERDVRTQVRWGIADFVHRFGRRPEGMWLPETAADVATLEELAAHDIAFTILEPHQAARTREDGVWRDTRRDGVDTGRPYRAHLPSGRNLAIFFYDGPTSRAVAFEGLLRDGTMLAERLVDAFDAGREGPQLVNIATDGESYGHHHRHGDMALAFALRELDADEGVHLTNYSAYLAEHPPTVDVDIVENTSWSCSHGVDRWRTDCGCADGGHPDWNQRWREPLRDALDWLRDDLAERYEQLAAGLLHDAWDARDDYIDVVLDRSPETRRRFLNEHAVADLSDEDRITVWKLLEMQRHALLMYTSCGWFFDDLGRIETIQVLLYAARAIQLAGSLAGEDVETPFVERLEAAKSNIVERGTGRDVYERHVRGAVADHEKVAAHHAISTLFEPAHRSQRLDAYRIDTSWRRSAEAGDARLAAGQVTVTSLVTEEATQLNYAVVHLGDHNVSAGVAAAQDDSRLGEVWAQLSESFAVGDLPETLRRLDANFGPERHTLRSLFPDGRERILAGILDGSVADAVARHRSIYRGRAPLMRYLTDVGSEIPAAFLRAAEIAINDDLRRAFEDEALDPGRVQGLIDDAARWDLALDTQGLALTLTNTIHGVTETVQGALRDRELFETFGPRQEQFFDLARTLVRFAQNLPFEVDLWAAQNLFYRVRENVYADVVTRAESGDDPARAWVEELRELGDLLGVAMPPAPRP